MIEKLIATCAKHKLLVVALTAAAIWVGWWCLSNIRMDALPDLSDTQVIVYSKWNQSPDIIEDQVTYPIVTALLGAPKVKAIRGYSDFGYSFVYVIFEDGTDIYWARSRVLEYLSKVQPTLPKSVQTELGPDATGLGWVFQYVLMDESGKNSLSDLRSYQDWFLRYALQSVPGVSEVASLGGFVRQYQIILDPAVLRSYQIPIKAVVEAVRNGNNDVGARLVEMSDREYMVRGLGYARSVEEFEQIAILNNPKTGVPIKIGDIGRVELGPDIRRGVSDWNGQGNVVSGIIVMREGENALRVIDRVKAKLKQLEPSLPEGVKVVTAYDRSVLIKESIGTLKHELIIEIIIVCLVILLFLWHIPSAIIPITTIPIAVLLSFIPMYFMGLTSNIMSLAGIAISIGVLVDGAIVEVENAYRKLQLWNDSGRKGDVHDVRLKALQEVGPSVFFSLLVIAVAFLPIFALEGQEGRLFHPLAYSKTFAMAIAAFLAVTLDPALRMFFTRMDFVKLRWRWLTSLANTVMVGKYFAEEKHPISKRLFKIYDPICRWSLANTKRVLMGATILFVITIPIFMNLGSEFMPPLNEGTILYMPTTLPGISAAAAEELLQRQDKVLKSFPEVETVLGKAGRADTATDPAPLSMMETIVVLKPKDQWPKRISMDELTNKMNAKLQIPGTTNAWTMPIRNRVDMLSTGMRTPIGIKVLGSDLNKIEEIGKKLEGILSKVPGTRTVFSERAAGGYFLDIKINREEIARYNLSVADVESVISSAIGGENVTTTIEGVARYPVNVRYARELRDDISAMKRVLVSTPSGAQIPLGQLASITTNEGPSMIRNEDGFRAGYVYVDVAGRDIGSYVKEAKRAVDAQMMGKLPAGYELRWSGQYEAMIRVKEKLKVLVPLTLFIICLLLYMNTKSIVKTGIVLLAVPFSAIGAVWLLYILGYNLSIAVWVGIIALLGLDAETGVFMLMFLDMSYNDAVAVGKMRNADDLTEAVVHGAVKRIRPKMMTVMAAMMGLLPIMWAMGTGADVMKRIAAPMVGGLATSFLLELLIYPVLYYKWRVKRL
ncbi:MAG: CusA/CzcA family heavy metal efflux RND transporter [Deltaproteobacteria bacterium CG11_big_fil_rev_8_21_14_0_20_47_16]|nr:MAG: CusA/CzcA family heavy metal efflux RND transporter [Deltaproteobacteria bacterium CG11_big_fil_rev_8_21_14_0_20_47_16]